jgi:fructose-1,6-bisphosphatase I
VAEQAGGAAYSASEPILDIQPEARHQRTPLILGSRREVEETVSIINGG